MAEDLRTYTDEVIDSLLDRATDQYVRTEGLVPTDTMIALAAAGYELCRLNDEIEHRIIERNTFLDPR